MFKKKHTGTLPCTQINRDQKDDDTGITRDPKSMGIRWLTACKIPAVSAWGEGSAVGGREL